MSLTLPLIQGAGFWLALLCYGVFLVWALARVPWRLLGGSRPLQHLVLGATVAIMVLWTLRAGISPGLGIHFLGVTTLTLMFGWELGLVSASLALLGVTLAGLESWAGFPVNGFCACLVPVLVSYLVLRLTEAWLPRQFFIYLFLCVCLGSALAAGAAGICMIGLLWLEGVYSGSKLVEEYLVYLPLIMYPEALLNGVLMTGMMVYYPDWIRTFDARSYIDDN